MKLETIAVHAGRSPDAGSGAVASPIVLSTTFERSADGSFPHRHIYSRTSNPNREALEASLAALEGGAAAVAFASGSAATTSVFQALAPGDHVIAPADIYYGTRLILQNLFGRWGLEATYTDLADVDQVRRALRPNTRLIWLETPSNPMLRITDIRRMADLAHEHGALCACDNTWATPVLQRPLDLGADLVMHSTTKYLGGNSDVMGGCIVTRLESEFFQRIRAFQTTGGAVLAPFDCWLILRSMPTLPCRMRVHSENALQLATFLSQHPNVSTVHYPGLTSHPGHAVAIGQMSRFGGMLSFEVTGGREPAMAVAARVRVFTRATSLGGPESLIEHRASIEGKDSKTPQGLLRMSIGLEHVDDLIEDLDQALGG